MSRLVDKGLINANWNNQSYEGIVCRSVVVFGLRNGNPKHVKTWNDLVKPGVKVVRPNPFTGGTQWEILAAYVPSAARQDGQAGERLPRDALQEQHRLPGLVAPERDQHLPRGQGRRPPHLRERGDLEREDPLRDPEATMRIDI